MNIDEKIKKELSEQATEIDEILAEEKGLFDFVMGSFRSNLKGWFVLINIIIGLNTLVMFWTGYNFFNSLVVTDQVFWGVCFLSSLIFQVAGKQWIWAEMTRTSMVREIKRVELNLSRQVAQFK